MRWAIYLCFFSFHLFVWSHNLSSFDSIYVVNQALATLAFFGVGVNLVLFLTRVLGQDNVNAANNVSKWIGTVYMFSLIGAFLSDSYWGRYLTCTVFQLVFVLVLHFTNISLLYWLFNFSPFSWQLNWIV